MQIEFAPDRGDHHETAVRFGEGAVTHEIYYRSGDIQLTPRCEAFAALALIPCMRQGWDLELDDPVSPRFASGLESIQRIFRNWNPALHYIEIRRGEAHVGGILDLNHVETPSAERLSCGEAVAASRREAGRRK